VTEDEGELLAAAMKVLQRKEMEGYVEERDEGYAAMKLRIRSFFFFC